MNVVLVNTNTIRPPLGPIGLLSLAAYIRERGWNVRLVDPCVSDSRPDLRRAVMGAVRDLDPDVIGFSIRNIDTTQMKRDAYFLPEAADTIRAVRAAFPRVPLVLGGAGFSLAPLAILEETRADFGIVGEGERSLDELLRKIEVGQDISAVPGLVFRSMDGRWKQNPPENMGPESLSRLPFQAIDLVDYGYYFNSGGAASVQTKRGCALKCAYCTYPLIEGGVYRLIDPVRVVDELEFFAGRGFDYFQFADSVFNAPRSHAVNVCLEIVRRELKIRWHAYMSPLRFDDELLDLLIRAGNDGIQFGIDSCSDRMLREFGKNFTTADIYRASEVCRDRGMEFGLNILIGMPGETLETVEETLAAIDEIRPTAAFITQGIRVYRGTPIHARLARKGMLQSETPLLEPFYYFSEELPADISQRLLDFSRARDFVYCDAGEKPPHTDLAAMELYRKGFRGPMWRILKKIKEAARPPTPNRPHPTEQEEIQCP